MIANIMCDLETTGVDAGCCILSIALVPFCTDLPLDTFYETISHTDSHIEGFIDDPQTLRWWDKQKPEIQQEAFGGTRKLRSVLESMSFYLQTIGDPKEIYLWGNGKDFDNVILSHALKRMGMKQPWHYRNNRCYRDLAAMYPMFPKGDVMQAHNALSDALAQASHATTILQAAKRGLAPTFTGVV